MTASIGIRRESKSKWERRVPLTPDHIRQLVSAGIKVVVQPSPIRIYPDAAFAEAGATVSDDLSDCRAILAVKEIPVDELLPEKTYVFFSHTIKGQRHNMPMLRRLLELRSRLIDYERIADEAGKRLVFFGRHAGYAGMIDSLHILGRRWLQAGYATPFANIKMAYDYADLADAKLAVQAAGTEWKQDLGGSGLGPLIVGFAGYGNVSGGAQDVFDALGCETLSPAHLLNTPISDLAPNGIYKVVFKEADLVRPLTGDGSFDLGHYYAHPGEYQARFSEYLPKISMVMNCLYWEPAYPRLVTREDIKLLWKTSVKPRLEVIGDLGCDIEGPIEFTLKATTQESPAFVYSAKDGTVQDGVSGDGPAVLAIDNLPCELAAEASRSFGDALLPFANELANCDASLPLDEVGLAPDIARAVITDRGSLTAPYTYLKTHIETGSNVSV